MNLAKKIQTISLKKDLKKGKSADYLAKTYEMDLLVENVVFMPYRNTCLFQDVASGRLYNAEGKVIGDIAKELDNFIVIQSEAEYGDYDIHSSYALYDDEGKCVIPHGCYMECFKAKDYVVLSMPMADSTHERVMRKGLVDDGATIMESTGKTIVETLENSTAFPKAVFVNDNHIINTSYYSIVPVPIKNQTEPLANNTIWIAQKFNEDGEVAVRMDKRFRLTETYRLPHNAHEEAHLFYEDSETKRVYKLNVDTKERINLRTGQILSLVTLARSRASKRNIAQETITHTSNDSEVEKLEYSIDDSVIL